jgi:hypothetical protein
VVLSGLYEDEESSPHKPNASRGHASLRRGAIRIKPRECSFTPFRSFRANVLYQRCPWCLASIEIDVSTFSTCWTDCVKNGHGRLSANEGFSLYTLRDDYRR